MALTASQVEAGVSLGTDLIKGFEGFSPVPYKDVVGIWTIGYGTVYYQDGTRVSPKDSPITKAEAFAMLKELVRKTYLPPVLSACPGLDSPQQLAALLSLIYNIGARSFSSSTLCRKVQAKKYAEVPEQFLRWNKAGGRVVQGLTTRRKAEAAVFVSG